MTTPSHEQQVNLSVQVYEPGIVYDASAHEVTAYTPAASHVETLVIQLDNYEHEIAAVGGYLSARITINDRWENIEGWIERGLNRHVEVYDEAQVLIWEGFVNRVEARSGGFTVVRGPLTDVANHVSVVYSELITATIPATTGATTRTAVAYDDASAAKYGIFERVLSLGTQSAAMAAQKRDVYLAENALPETDKQWGTGGGGLPSMTLECLGYIRRLESYVYTDVAGGTWNIETKLADVLDADPNLLFSSANASFYGNTVVVSHDDNDYRTAWAVVKGLVEYGDLLGGNDERTFLGVYGGRHIWYEVVPSDIVYHQRLSDPAQRVTTPGGTEVQPWNVLPGKWLMFPDFLVGRSLPVAAGGAALRTDPRMMFIERVGLGLPLQLVLDGGRVKTLPQLLAREGLGGI